MPKTTVRIYSSSLGKQVSATGNSKQEANRLIQEKIKELETQKVQKDSFKEAYDFYLKRKKSKLSVTTYRDYRLYEKYYKKFLKKRIYSITDDEVQDLINRLSEDKSPKTVTNIMSLFFSVIRYKCPSKTFCVEMPKNVRPRVKRPSEDDVRRLIGCCEDSPLCAYIYLGAFCGMRLGEICALARHTELIDFKNKTISIEYSYARNEHNEFILKEPKTYGSYRVISVPDNVLKVLKEKGLSDKIDPRKVSYNLGRLLKKNGIVPFTFHSLRAFCASEQLRQGLSLAYVQNYGGWSNPNVLLKCYNYSLQNEECSAKWNKITAQF